MKLRNNRYKELDKPVTLKVYTKCPTKWTLIDNETGEVYEGKNEVIPGDNGWEKIINLNNKK